jgi:hypothetical protein
VVIATTRVANLYRVVAQTGFAIPVPNETGQPESCPAWATIVWVLPQQDKLTLNQTVRQHEKNGVVNQFINRLNSYHLLIIY